MAEFAADLRRYLANEPIHAKPPSAVTRAIKWSKRNPALSSAGAVALLGLIVVSSLLFVQARTATALAHSNLDLEAQTTLAAASAASAHRAQRESEQLTADVLSLSAQKDLDDLVAEAQTLWPAHPAMIPAYEDWLRRAKELIEGRSADEARGVQERPSLAEREAQLLELRSRARPLTEERVTAERASHPRLAELETKQAELTWRSRMLGLEAWPNEAEVEAVLAQEALPSNATAINSLAWRLVSPELPIYGQEQRALLLARRAVAASDEAERAGMRDTLAWALFRLGRFDEALAEERAALAEPGAKGFATLNDSAASLEQAVAAWRGAEAARRDERDALAAEVAELRSTVRERRTFEYDDSRDAWWTHQLSQLVADLKALRNPKTGLMGDTLAEPFGWGVTKRLEFAKSIAERSIEGAEAERLWGETIEAIQASPKYGGLVLAPQMGLLPIGMDLDSRLFEFAHLQTGDPAVRADDGKLLLTEATGLVLVLIPGGAFWMGAQADDPNEPNYDPQAGTDESPVHEVELSAYFLSKYEMTQGQWARVAAHNPSYYQPPSRYVRTLLHPVEQVSWPECMALMEHLGLTLPSQAQWENGARGGTNTPWWTGRERESLRGKVNIADRTASQAGSNLSASNDWPDVEDGGVVHMEAGHYPANGFGLHEVAGNVCEWCLDGFERPGAAGSQSTVRAIRGGSFGNAASSVRSADVNLIPEGGLIILGLRPAKDIAP
jgi:formylglycine-generating enzyme required for sulfatase activity